MINLKTITETNCFLVYTLEWKEELRDEAHKLSLKWCHVCRALGGMLCFVQEYQMSGVN